MPDHQFPKELLPSRAILEHGHVDAGGNVEDGRSLLVLHHDRPHSGAPALRRDQ